MHIPFCAHKCGYCDFASLAGVDHLADRYLAALEREMAMHGGRRRRSTRSSSAAGTPTRLDARQLERLLAMIRRWFPLAPGGEWTVEANPGTLDAEKADVLAAGGVNRVSLGAQSFQPALLRVLERNHAPEEVARALDLVRPRFPRWSFDLIFGVPGSTLAHLGGRPGDRAWRSGRRTSRATAWSTRRGPRSGSSGRRARSARSTRRSSGRCTRTRSTGSAAPGWRCTRSRTSPRPGHESRHNLVYWANDAYFGVGVGAARYVRGVRSVNTRDLPAYLRRIEAGEPATGPTETLEPEARARETAVLMLRRTGSGIDRDDFARRTGFDLDALAGPVLEPSRRAAACSKTTAGASGSPARGSSSPTRVLCDLL